MPLLFSILLITLLLWFNAIDLLTTGSKLFIVESWRLGYAKLIKCLIEIGSFAINDNLSKFVKSVSVLIVALILSCEKIISGVISGTINIGVGHHFEY